MSWQENSIIIKPGLEEAFNRYCMDKSDSMNYSSIKNDIIFTGSNGTSVNIDDLVSIKASMGNFGNRIAEAEEAIMRLQAALKGLPERETPSFAALSQFAQKDGKKKSY